MVCSALMASTAHPADIFDRAKSKRIPRHRAAILLSQKETAPIQERKIQRPFVTVVYQPFEKCGNVNAGATLKYYLHEYLYYSSHTKATKPPAALTMEDLLLFNKGINLDLQNSIRKLLQTKNYDIKIVNKQPVSI